jgi:hypothetical protein
MLAEPKPENPRQPPQSQRQAYAEFVEQRVEEFKEQLGRHELLQLADEAVRELDADQGQYVLTEVLANDHVDRLIKKRLRLPTFRRWREKHQHLREAQRTPTHWGFDSDTPLTRFVRMLEPNDVAVVVGTGSTSAAMYLAAHEAQVLLIDSDLAQIEAAETMAASESLSARFDAMVVQLGTWFPSGIHAALSVIDATTLGKLDATERVQLIELLKEKTIPGGIHFVSSAAQTNDVLPIAPDAVQTHYGDWYCERGKKHGRSRWFSARRP